MSQVDHSIWLKFIEKHGGEFTGFHFDVPLGTSGAAPEGYDSKLLKMWEAVTWKRIDAVGVKRDRLLLIEVGASAGMPALGRALNYTVLWNEHPPNQKIVVPVIVTDVADPNIKTSAEKIGVAIIETGV